MFNRSTYMTANYLDFKKTLEGKECLEYPVVHVCAKDMC